MCKISGKDEIRLRKDADAIASKSSDESVSPVSKNELLDAIEAQQRQRQQQRTDKSG